MSTVESLASEIVDFTSRVVTCASTLGNEAAVLEAPKLNSAVSGLIRFGWGFLRKIWRIIRGLRRYPGTMRGDIM